MAPRPVPGPATGRTALGLAALLGTAGAVHLVRPAVFAPAVPLVLGRPRPWVLASGAAELGCAAALAHPRTRSLGGGLAAALLLAVWPGNVSMALRARGTGRAGAVRRVVTLLRLPLQVPLVRAALRVARADARSGSAA